MRAMCSRMSIVGTALCIKSAVMERPREARASVQARACSPKTAPSMPTSNSNVRRGDMSAGQFGGRQTKLRHRAATSGAEKPVSNPSPRLRSKCAARLRISRIDSRSRYISSLIKESARRTLILAEKTPNGAWAPSSRSSTMPRSSSKYARSNAPSNSSIIAAPTKTLPRSLSRWSRSAPSAARLAIVPAFSIRACCWFNSTGPF